MGIVWISIPAHDQANRFNAVASLGTLGTVFRACRRLPETTTFRFYIRPMPSEQQAARRAVIPLQRARGSHVLAILNRQVLIGWLPVARPKPNDVLDSLRWIKDLRMMTTGSFFCLPKLKLFA